MSDDATRVMTAGMPTGTTGTFDRTMVASGATMMPLVNDPYRTQMGGTTTCPVCKSNTPLMETFCGECGYLLSSPVVENLEVPQEEAPAALLIAEADGQRHRLREGINTLGRQGTDVLVNDGTISRVHAKITVEHGSVTIEDMGSTNGTKVGDLRIGANQPTLAAHGQVLRFGNWKARLEMGTPSESAGASASATVAMGSATMMGATRVYQPGELNVPAEAAPNATVLEPAILDADTVALLEVVSGPGIALPITRGTITIGRRPGNSIVITNNSYISGRHAQIETDETGTYLTDLESTNGTFVNGQKLSPNERQLLLDGDEVKLGQTRYHFALSVKEEPIEISYEGSPDGSPPGQEFGAINE